MNERAKPRVLYLDDDKANLNSFKANFKNEFEIFIADSPIKAYNMIEEHQIQVVITDHNMPSMNGVEFLESISKDYPNVQRILLTGYTELVSVVEAVNKGKVYRIITKPFNLNEIKGIILEAFDNFASMLEKETLISQLQKQNQQFEFILRQKLLS
jgi:DNA-binding NtrC family response regulator